MDRTIYHHHSRLRLRWKNEWKPFRNALDESDRKKFGAIAATRIKVTPEHHAYPHRLYIVDNNARTAIGLVTFNKKSRFDKSLTVLSCIEPFLLL
ncbi:MAG TPA: hypothetical protein VFZ67_06550 [Nitrososphaera sp.]